jgi:membrane protease YdiL (CAAX protease family)
MTGYRDMNRPQASTLMQNPLFRVAITWLCTVILPILSALVALAVLNADFSTARKVFGERPYLTIYFEFVGVGLIPMLFTFFGKDALSQYGLNKTGFVKSLLLSMAVVAVHYGYSFLTTGQWIAFDGIDYGLSFPANVWYGVLGIFAYGPLEAFFFIWLVYNTEQVFKSKNLHRFWGLFVTAVIFGLLHILTTQSLSNALNISVTFFALGWICTYTKNSIGPMVAWTMINGQVWFLAQLLWH